MTLLSGSRLGSYEIVSRLGAGGMGEVFKARDVRLKRNVAIKVLPAEFANNPQRRMRFEREARAISQLNHPHICTLHDIGHENGTSFLVMELLEGESLGERLARGALPLADVLRYGEQIAGALDRAHRAGIVHRDLKPDNIMITRDGAKLLDFGLARYDELSAGTPTDQTLTAEGTLIGTYPYMAPEQLQGQPADARSDIFALGAVFYEMVTGKGAFEATTRGELVAQIMTVQPPSLPISAPATLRHLVEKCLEKNPEVRWQSAYDIAEQLRWMREVQTQNEAPTARWTKWRVVFPWSIAGVAVVLAAFAFRARTFDKPRPSVLSMTSIAPPPDSDFALEMADSGSMTISPNGRMITFALRGVDTSALWLRPIDSATARPIPGTDNARFPFWSPDSRHIAFFAGGKLKKVDMSGSPPIVLCNAVDGRAGSWNRAGVLLFSPSSLSPIHRVSEKGGRSTPVTVLDRARRESTHRWAAFLPDGNHFLYTAATHAGTRSDESNAIFVASLDGRRPRFLFNASSNVAYASGHLIYQRARQLLARPFDPDRLEFTGPSFVVADRVRFESPYFRAIFGVSDEGTLVYHLAAADEKTSLVWLDRRGNEIGRLAERDLYRSVQLSPDDTVAAIVLEHPKNATRDIWVYDFRQNRKTRLTFSTGDETSPVWSPDGRRIAFLDMSGIGGILVKDVDGRADERLLVAARGGEMVTPSDWSGDGTHLAATRLFVGGSAVSDVAIVPLVKRGDDLPFRNSPASDNGAVFSPDGRWVAYRSDESERLEVYVTRLGAPGAKWQVSTEGVRGGIEWRANEIIWMGLDGRLRSASVSVRQNTIEFGRPIALFSARWIREWDVSRDGTRFLAIEATSTEREPITIIRDWPALRPVPSSHKPNSEP